MISKYASQNFLKESENTLDDFSQLKQWSNEELDLALKELGVCFVTEPRKHQKVGTLLGILYPQVFYLLGMGTGKTKIVLDVFAYRRYHDGFRRLLFLVPNTVNIQAVKDQITEHRPELSFMGLEGDAEERKQIALNGTYDVLIATYRGLMTLLTIKDPKKKKLVLVDSLVKQLATRFDCLVLDESSNLKSHSSLSFKMCKKLAQSISCRFALTGTPFGRNVEDLWSQLYLIDKGKSLGPTLGLFRELFFIQKKAYWTRFEYEFNPETLPVLTTRLNNRSLHYEIEECADLPELIKIKIPLILPQLFIAKYEALKKQFREQWNAEEKKNVFMKMRQLTSGIISMGEIQEVLEEHPKIEALLELLDEIAFNEKILIFHYFVASGDLIERKLQGKVKFVRIGGGTSEVSKKLNSFQKDSECRVLLLNVDSGSFGLNLQVARYVIFYESSVSCIVRAQGEKRCHRLGQNKTVLMYDLYVKDSVDEQILLYLEQGRDLYEEIIGNNL